MKPNARLVSSAIFTVVTISLVAGNAAAQQDDNDTYYETDARPGIVQIAAPVDDASPPPAAEPLHVHVDCSGPCHVAIAATEPPPPAPVYPVYYTPPPAPVYYVLPAEPVYYAPPPPVVIQPSTAWSRPTRVRTHRYAVSTVFGFLSLVAGGGMLLGGVIMDSNQHDSGNGFVVAGSLMFAGGFVLAALGAELRHRQHNAMSRMSASVSPTPGGAVISGGLVF